MVAVTEGYSRPGSGCGLSKSRQSGEKGGWGSHDSPHPGQAGLDRHTRVLKLQQGLKEDLMCVSADPGIADRWGTSLGPAPYHCGVNILPGDTKHKLEGYREQLVPRTQAG